MELRICEVEGGTDLPLAGLCERLHALGIKTISGANSGIPVDIPVLLVGRGTAPLCAWLRSEARVAPSLAWLEESDLEASRVELLAAGATDVFCAGVDEDLLTLVAYLQRFRETRAFVESAVVAKTFGGKSAIWVRALHELVAVARSDGVHVLISGETGTGKDGAARLVHDAGRCSAGEFIVVHCGAIVSTLSGSELFGHRRGAFSGAERDRDGAIARANGGTLFLDEVAELTPALQTELLRVLQDGTYRPVGEDRERVSRFRVVAATHRDLKDEVARGTFREDLYYRLRGTEVRMPPLRERRADIPVLIQRFAREFLGENAIVDTRIERLLLRHSFPGNVRELKSIIRAASSRSPDGKTLRLACLPTRVLLDCAGSPGWTESDLNASAEDAVYRGVSFNEFVDAAKDALVRAALGLSRGNVREAAQRISVSERCVQLRRRSDRASGVPPTSDSDEPLEVAS